MNFLQGVDIVENLRVERIYIRYGSIFLKKILNNQELKFIPSKEKQVINFISGRFAAKEALSKAIGTGFRNGINFRTFSVLNDSLGKPIVILQNEGQEYLKKKKINLNNLHINLSISHEKKFSIEYGSSLPPVTPVELLEPLFLLGICTFGKTAQFL